MPAPKTTTEHWEVVYTYYQYNTGAADNGTYTATKVEPDAGEAMLLAHRLNEAAAQRLPSDDIYQLEKDILDNPGYFISAKAFHVRTWRQELEMPRIPDIPGTCQRKDGAGE